MDKLSSKEEILKVFADGQKIMIGGFAGTGAPFELIKILLESEVKDLTVITNDTGFSGEGSGEIFTNYRGSKLVCSYIGMSPECLKMVKEQQASGQIQLELSPQGTLVERIRAGGAGLGGVLTPTGLGTIIETGKEKVEVDGKAYLLEKPLFADVALIKAWKADTLGNLLFRGTSRNYNPIMATAATTVIVEAEEIVPAGTFDPDHIITPGVFVNMILMKGGDD